MRQEILEIQAPTKQIAIIRKYRHMILNTSARKKRNIGYTRF
jgi:hypothetical protein